MANDEDDDKILCANCEKDITDDDGDTDTQQWNCEECNNIFCDDCCVQFENCGTIICTGCIEKVYPREEKVVEKIVEKIIEVPKETIKVMGFSEPIL